MLNPAASDCELLNPPGATNMSNIIAFRIHTEGLRKAGLDNILTAASRKSTLLTVNGMELAALRVDDSDMLDLSR